MQNQKNSVKEAFTYFKKSPILRRMLQQFAEKYRSLGRVGGTVRLQITSPTDRESLSGLLGKDLSRQSAISVSTTQLEQALQRTRFADLTLQEILFSFIGDSILTRVEEKERYESKKKQYFRKLARGCKSQAGRDWLEHIITKGRGSRGIHLSYDRDQDKLHQQLSHVLLAVQELPGNGYERLPVFAARVTGDPHGFDPTTEQGRLFVEALRFIHRQIEEHSRRSLSSEEFSELLASFGILRDDLSSFVTCTGLLAFRKQGRQVATWEEAHSEGVVLNVPLREVVRIDTLVSAAAKSVYVVENPGVFSEIIDCFAGRPYPPLICTHGQFRLAALLLLDKLARAGVRIFYSGDFDPEGLQMAQRLLKRYPGIGEAWRYGVEDYTRSNPSHPLNTARLNKLDRIDHPELIAVKGKIAVTGQAGYQEQIIPSLIEDLKQYF